METAVGAMLKLRGWVVALFLGGAVVSLALSAMVQINYDMVDYLPDGAPSTIAMEVMDQAYDQSVPNLRVMVPRVTIPQALGYKQQLEEVPGVEAVTWLDDQVDIHIPLETLDPQTVADWYQEDCALFSLVAADEGQQETLARIREIIGEEGAISGNPMDTVNAQNTTSAEVSRMMGYIIPLLFGILLLTTTSWFEPVLFMVNVGVAIAINAGTNLLFGEISFITQTTGAILQLACSMDYAIFLLDRFDELRETGLEPLEAMAQAVVRSASSILSSGLTTAVGFAALIAMQFKVGPDMGFVLAKGIGFSLVTTLVFLPCLSMFCYRLVDKTRHRSFMPSFRGFARWLNRIKAPMTVLVFLCLIPCALAQNHISFLYGMSGMASPGSQVYQDREAINSLFGESSSFAILVPKGSLATEQALNDDLKELPQVSSVLSYVENVGASVPESYLPRETLSQLNSDTYTRLVVTARIPPESPETFAFVDTLRELAQQHYPDACYLAGEAANVADMRSTITEDSVKVNLIAIGAIAVILLFTFHSASLPVLLLLAIESSVFINISVPYFTGQDLNYIGYLIISSVQLGATVDYAILFTNRYLENRAALSRREAVQKTTCDTAAGILTSAGLVLGFVSTNSVISQLGILVARGAVLSTLLVMGFLPALLVACEGLIRRTSRKMVFFDPRHPKEATL